MIKSKAKNTNGVLCDSLVVIHTVNDQGEQRGSINLRIKYGSGPEDPLAKLIALEMSVDEARVLALQLKDAAKKMERWMSTN